jgi:hypothetical protein
MIRVRYRRPPDRRTRPQRWDNAVAEQVGLQVEYAAWNEALPDSRRDTPTAEGKWPRLKGPVIGRTRNGLKAAREK